MKTIYVCLIKTICVYLIKTIYVRLIRTICICVIFRGVFWLRIDFDIVTKKIAYIDSIYPKSLIGLIRKIPFILTYFIDFTFIYPFLLYLSRSY